MKRVFATAVLVILTGCTQVATPVVPTPVHRNTDAQIASQTNVTADRMAASWVIRQRFADQPGPVSGMALSTLPGGALQWRYETGACADDVCTSRDVLVLLDPSGPGRWTASDPAAAGFAGEMWVLWMDFDSRTVAIGTPSGEFGWIMDKNATGGSDRITAARDIMEWFGYDMTRIEEVIR